MNSVIRRFTLTLPNYDDGDIGRISEYFEKDGKYAILGRDLSSNWNTPSSRILVNIFFILSLEGGERLAFRCVVSPLPCPHPPLASLAGGEAGQRGYSWVVQWLCSYVVVCYSSLRRPSRFNAIKAAVGDRCHIEKAKGNDIQNKEYCSKEGQFTEWGTPVGQGRRSDLLEIVQLVQSGETSMERIARECPVQVIKYYKGIEAYIRLTRPIPERDFKTEVRFYYGRPGSGKSRRALAEAKATGGRIYYKPRGDWWDGYKQHECVIIDDFYGWIKYDDLLKICDRYPYQVQSKDPSNNLLRNIYGLHPMWGWKVFIGLLDMIVQQLKDVVKLLKK